jgi:apolipoprotein N-acyltransferase
MRWMHVQPKPRPNGNTKKLFVFGLIAIVIAATELVFCFVGPMAFVQKPSLILFPPFATGLSDEEKTEVMDFIERQIALTNSYAITSHSFMEEFFIRTDPDFNESALKPENYEEAEEIARRLEFDRFAIAWMYKGYHACELSVSIRNAADGEKIRYGWFSSNSFENLLQGIDKEGNPLDFQEKLAFETRGITFTDYIVLALLALQFLVGLTAVKRREPGIFAELLLAFSFIMFLFAYIYSLSANMDYVQRYIASSGQLRLAESTAREQLYALLRYGPMLLLNGAYYIWHRVYTRRKTKTVWRDHWVYRYIAHWALPWVILSAVLFGFSFPSALTLNGMGWFAWFSLVPTLLVLLTHEPGRGVFYGVVFGTLQALVVNYWHGTYDYVSLHLVTITFVVEYLLFMMFLVWLIKMSGKWGFLTAAGAWLVFDYIRSVGVLGYPWGLIGTTQYRFIPLIQVASITGVWGVNFVVILCNTALAWTLVAGLYRWKWFTGETEEPRDYGIKNMFQRGVEKTLRSFVQSCMPLAAFSAIFAVSVLTGAVILYGVQQRLYHDPDVERATVVLVQQNTDPRKHEYKENVKKLMTLTDEAMRQLPHKPDLVAWPEGAFKLDIRYWNTPKRRKTYWGKLVQEFLDYQRNLETWLITGTQDHVMVMENGEEQKLNYNSSVLLDGEGQINGFYHKIRLVPFSEYFPLDREKHAKLYEHFQSFGISNWTIGEERVVYEHERMRIATPICFEDVFSDHVRRFVLGGVDIILNLSNDYWSLSPVEGTQHGILALFRAVENQRPVLRSTSSGYTVYIDATGRIQPGSPAPYTAGFAVAHVPLPERRLTIYTRWGDWFPLSCGATLLLYLLWLGLRRLYRSTVFWGRKPEAAE